MIRAALGRVTAVDAVDIDLEGREVAVVHRTSAGAIVDVLEPLGFGAELLRSEPSEPVTAARDLAGERRVLRQVLYVNASMFVVEMAVGWVAQSAGLLADSLDMLADASVYAMSLYVVGRGAVPQRRAARVSGVLQLGLSLGMVFEVARRAVYGSEPSSGLMMSMAAVALAANLLCVWLLRRHREGGAHMRASWIFTTSDALANIGVIVAGLLVLALRSPLPDLIIGGLIALVVLRSAVRILRPD